MQTRIIPFFLAFILIQTGCSRKKPHVWTALLMGTVSEIKPSAAHSDRVSYILRQTHEPLFRFDENNQATSRLLTKWSRSDDYKDFQLCPNQHLSFEKNEIFNTRDIKNSIKSAWNGIAKYSLVEENGCLAIHFLKPRFNFFETLASFGTAPSRPTSDHRIELGLGPFRVSKLADDEIVLLRKIPNANKRFNKIVLKNIDFLSQEQINDHSIQEFNLISRSKIPHWVPEEYATYPNSNLRTYDLVINIPDLHLRKAIFNCLDVAKLRNAFFQSQSFRDIGSLFPIGIKGAVSQKVHQSCIGFSGFKLRSRPLVFLNWKPEHDSELRKLFAELEVKTGIVIKSKPCTATELAHHFIDTHSGYDLGIVYIQNEFSDMADFLETFVDPNKIIHSLKFPDLAKKFEQFKNTADQEKRQKFGIALNNDILNQAIALPLFQPINHIYYPKDIKLPQVGSTFNTWPEVDQIQ